MPGQADVGVDFGSTALQPWVILNKQPISTAISGTDLLKVIYIYICKILCIYIIIYIYVYYMLCVQAM